MHIVYIVGNRPQFIKLAILHQQLKQYDFIKETIIHTGQHFSVDMSDIFFDDLNIELPIINLEINSLDHVSMIGRTMEALQVHLKLLKPDFVVVFGDTNATLAGALAAKKMNFPVVHIEAGIRTFDETMPEESNRYITDRISDINFCCTYLGMEHLEREGFNQQTINSKIVNSGDLMLDAFYYFNQKAKSETGLFEINDAYILTTIHRKQNIENPQVLYNIIEAFNEINKQITLVCPLHPNTRRIMAENQIEASFKVLPPQGYFQLQTLLQNAQYVITDSGGLQREAFFAQKPTLIIMEKPFWPEVIAHGKALCCSSTKEAILSNFDALKSLMKDNNVSIFGNGQAAAIIAGVMVAYYNEKQTAFLTPQNNG